MGNEWTNVEWLIELINEPIYECMSGVMHEYIIFERILLNEWIRAWEKMCKINEFMNDWMEYIQCEGILFNH